MTIARNLSFLAEGVSSTGVLGATYGGTGQSSITTGDLLYGSASNTISKLAIGSTGTVLRVVAGVPSWGTDYTGTVTSVAALTLGTTGTDLSSTVANGTTTPVITLNVPTASATNRGVLSSTDWTTFNNKGSGSVTSVAATVPSFLSISGSPITSSGTLAITYSGTALPVANGGSGLTSLTANYIPYGNGTSAFNSSANFQYTGSNLLVNTSTTYSPYAKAHFYNGIAVAIDSSNGGFYLGCTTSGSELAYLSLGGNYNLGSTGQIALATDTSKEILFGIANVEAMRIGTSRGVSIGNTTDPGAGALSVTNNLLVGTTTANGKARIQTANNEFSGLFEATNASYSSEVVTIRPSRNTTNGSFYALSYYNNGAGAYKFYVIDSGAIYSTSIVITSISDERLKENIRDIDTGIDAIMAIKPRKFDWKEGQGQDKKNAAGFIAQEFEQVFPNSVSTSKAGEDGIEYMTMNHEELIPTLVKAIQEQQAIIEQLKEKVGL